MSDSLREQIIQNFQTAIRNVRKGSGYQFDIDYSSVQRGNTLTVNLDVLPAIYVFEGDERTIEREHEIGEDLLMLELDVNIEIWCSDADNLSQVANNLEADVIKAIMTDHTRGGIAMYTERTGTTPFFLENSHIGGRIVSFTVRYEAKENDPYNV
jgi:hypothetical protein